MKKLEGLIAMLLFGSSNVVEILSSYKKEEGKDRSERSSSFSDSEVESDDQGSIFGTLKRKKIVYF